MKQILINERCIAAQIKLVCAAVLFSELSEALKLLIPIRLKAGAPDPDQTEGHSAET